MESERKNTKNRKRVSQLQTIDSDELLKVNLNLLLWFMPEGYILQDEQKPVITDLLYYFNGDPQTSFDLSKGICLMGNWGVGKTILFDAFRGYLAKLTSPNPNIFQVTSMEGVILELTKSGNMNRFTWNLIEKHMGVMQRHPQNLVINEFGVRYDGKHYGSDINELLDSFLMIRYEIFHTGKLTHVTTNYDWDDIKEKYEIKLHDRFREMFNFVPFPGEKSLRK